MSRETVRSHKIALLATGDEICNGDILNTNSQEIARKLMDHGMHVGMHLSVADNIAAIENSIDFLLQQHDALIITGGLGPTSDDLTRFALAHSIKQELVFHEASWQLIVERLQRFGYATLPQSNRQQALFPAGADIIPNPNGTAAGCMVRHDKKIIFMLPGPPTECLPMFHQVVLPELKNAGFQQVDYRKHWFLFGVSEGQIAETLDGIAKPYECVTGYRLFYPYIEFKIYTNNQHDFAAIVPQIERAIAPYLIQDGQHTASELLRTQIEKLNFQLNVHDQATGGLLESTLKTPATHARLNFTADSPHIVISGLDEFWQHATVTQTKLALQMKLGQRDENRVVEIPFRGSRVKLYAVEFVCWEILKFLN